MVTLNPSQKKSTKKTRKNITSAVNLEIDTTVAKKEHTVDAVDQDPIVQIDIITVN